jgi:hypothetical protein
MVLDRALFANYSLSLHHPVIIQAVSVVFPFGYIGFRKNAVYEYAKFGDR